MNLIDRAIGAFDPVRAARRLHARHALQQYSALTGFGNDPMDAPARGGSRFWRPWARDARGDIMPTITSDRAKSRELARTSPIAAGAINTNVDRVVGTGLALAAAPNAAVLGWTPEQVLEFKATVQAEFSLWSDSVECDLTGQQNFYDAQGLVLRSALESGDCFTLMPDGDTTPTQPYKLRLQILEADRVGNPGGQWDSADRSGGIQFDQNGRPTHAYLYDRHPGAGYVTGAPGTMWAGNWIQLVGSSGRRRMLHHLRKLRPGMSRGVPYLAPIIECIKQITRYSEAEISAAVVSALFTVFIETDTGDASPVFSGADGGGPDPATGEINMGPGAVVGLAKGEKPTFADPSRPNPNFGGFFDACMVQIGMATGIPRELLVKQFNSSYSASKAALLDAFLYFRGVRTWLARGFCQPVYETWLAEAVSTGRISAPGFFGDPLTRWAYTRASWHGDSMGSINPKDEVAAYSAAIEARLMTRERAEWELFGTDFDQTLDRKISEEQRLKANDMLPAPRPGAAAPAPSSEGATQGNA